MEARLNGKEVEINVIEDEHLFFLKLRKLMGLDAAVEEMAKMDDAWTNRKAQNGQKPLKA